MEKAGKWLGHRGLLGLALILGLVAALALAVAVPATEAGATARATDRPIGTDAPAAPADAAPTPVEQVPPRMINGQTVENIVFVLADDLDWATFRNVPRLVRLTGEGVTLRNQVVTDSLCCPSRSSILRSQYVHSHGVTSNVGLGLDPSVANSPLGRTMGDALGGWEAFSQKGHEADCLPVWLHDAGVTTGFLGKYLNGYGNTDPLAIPAGWDRWFVPVTTPQMYRGYGYTINDDGDLRTYDAKASSLLSDVLAREAVDFIRTTDGPFYLQVNPTAPHEPAPVAPRHRDRRVRATLPGSASLNARGEDAPRWRGRKHAIGGDRLQRYTRMWQDRVRSTESVADIVDAVRDALERTGKADSTLVVVGSDNGFHVASRRLPPGKRTPYHEDTVVPYVFLGPGLAAGESRAQVTSTIDLAPTFADLLGARVPELVEGRSLVDLLATGAVADWRTGVLTESLGKSALGDPDYTAFKPPNFRALRTADWLYVEYLNGARELFDRVHDPAEVDNVVQRAPATTVAALSAQLAALADCSGAPCRTADTAPVPVPAP